MTAPVIGRAQVPLSSNLAIEQTMAWPRLAWEREQSAYADGWTDRAGQAASGGVDDEVAELASNISARLAAGLKLARKIWAVMNSRELREAIEGTYSDADLLDEVASGWETYLATAGDPFAAGNLPDGESTEFEARAYWKGYFAGLEDESKRSAAQYAAGMVDGCKIGNGVDPDTDEPYEDPDQPRSRGVVAAFKLGRDVERRRWQRRLDDGYMAGYADGLAGRTAQQDTTGRYGSGYRDGLNRRTEVLGEAERGELS